MSRHSAQWISSISITRSNLDELELFLKHWTQLNQNYNYVFQSMLSSQRAYVDSGEERDTTRWAITQRSESLQPHLLDQTLIFFDYFWSIEFSSIRATIMSLKLCQVVNVYKLIQARKDAKRWKSRSKLRSNIFNLIY